MVCLLSFLAAGVVTWVLGRLRPQVPQLGRAWVQLDRAALVHNVAALRALLPPGCQLMPAVKADAYGHGPCRWPASSRGSGVSAFCVACLSEGIQLRKGGIRGEHPHSGIHPPGPVPPAAAVPPVPDGGGRGLRPPAGGLWPHPVRPPGGGHGDAPPGGGQRPLGGDPADLFPALPPHPGDLHPPVYRRRHHLPGSGLCPPPGPGLPGAAGAPSEPGDRPCPRSTSWRSHGLLNYPDLGGDYARVGIALYGLLSAREDRNLAAPDLRPVLSLRARVASVKTLSPGCAAGYGLAFVAQRPTKVAVLAIGYADGLPRTLTGGQVLLHGCRCLIAGRICMDQTLVDVTEIPAVDPGDVAVPPWAPAARRPSPPTTWPSRPGPSPTRSSAAWAPGWSGSSDNPKAPAASRRRNVLPTGFFHTSLQKPAPGTEVVPCQGRVWRYRTRAW